ncbi:hypothetical protein [Paraburkholderia sediminicola]|uniref:hypothetical protein n=1 Tax=Paraburkholderia sediminicola TaxID=458836 RepID=UPI0038B6CA3D
MEKNEDAELNKARQVARIEALTKRFTKSANDAVEHYYCSGYETGEIEKHFLDVGRLLQGRGEQAPADTLAFSDVYIDSVRVMVIGAARAINEPFSAERDYEMRGLLRRLVIWGKAWPSEYRADLAQALEEGFKIAGVPFPDLALVSDEQKFSEAHLFEWLDDALRSTYPQHTGTRRIQAIVRSFPTRRETYIRLQTASSPTRSNISHTR